MKRLSRNWVTLMMIFMWKKSWLPIWKTPEWKIDKFKNSIFSVCFWSSWLRRLRNSEIGKFPNPCRKFKIRDIIDITRCSYLAERASRYFWTWNDFLGLEEERLEKLRLQEEEKLRKKAEAMSPNAKELLARLPDISYINGIPKSSW